MGWADCGTDSEGRPIGYGHSATCDFPGCDKRIDRGLAYACGDMHGDQYGCCEGYYCDEHLWSHVSESSHETFVQHGCPDYNPFEEIEA